MSRPSYGQTIVRPTATFGGVSAPAFGQAAAPELYAGRTYGDGFYGSGTYGMPGVTLTMRPAFGQIIVRPPLQVPAAPLEYGQPILVPTEA